MTGQERDHGEVLSRVLHSTTDQIEPVGDGLTKIQARLAQPWLKRQWWLLRSEVTILGWVLAVRCQSWFSTIRSRYAAGVTAGGRTAGKAGAPLRNSVGSAMTWLRPALAVAGAVVLVVAGVFALGQIRGTLVGLSNENPPGTSNSGQPGGAGGTNGSGGPAGSGSPSTTQRTSRSPSPGSTPSGKVLVPSAGACSPAGTPPVNSPSPAPSPTSASPTPSPTSESPTPSPTTPTPSPTNSAGPLVTGSPPPIGLGGGQVEAIRLTALVACQPTPSPVSSPTNQAPAGP
jgi:hypothetical protein